MQKLHFVLCILLAAAMICSFSACDRTAGNEGDKAPTIPIEIVDEESAAPSEATPDEASAATSMLPDPYAGRSDLVILNWEEYEKRSREIQPGSVLNYAASYDVPSQLPWNCLSEGWLIDNIYEGLLYMYMNDPADIRGCIAQSWDHSDDSLTWTFHIRDGVKFHDGTICDATAIEKAWEYTEQAVPSYMTNCNITSWEATNTSTLVVHLSAPCAYFEQVMSGVQLMLASPTALDLYGKRDNRAAVGTGPYYIESYTSGVSIVLKANPNYYLEEKMPCIETVNFKIFKSQDSVVEALLDGKTDGARIICQTDGDPPAGRALWQRGRLR